MKFSEIPGLEKEKEVLIKSVQNNHIAHAQLFLGGAGTGVFPMAIAYAQYINCLDKKEMDSCGECSSCSKYQKFIHPDLHFIYPTVTTKDAAANSVRSEGLIVHWRSFLLDNPFADYRDWMVSLEMENKQGAINAAESRSILKKVSLKAFEAEYKVVIIWIPELMNSTAANALLKILEEPPEKTLFLLISYDAERLLTTVLSRTQKFQVRNFRNEELESYLKTKSKDSNSISQAIQLAEGSLNSALKNLEHAENDLFIFFRDWMRLCFQKNVEGVVNMSNEFQKLGRETQKNVLNYGINLFRNVILQIAGAESIIHLPEQEANFVKKFATITSDEKLESYFSLFNDAHYNILRNANPKITFTTLSLEVIKKV